MEYSILLYLWQSFAVPTDLGRTISRPDVLWARTALFEFLSPKLGTPRRIETHPLGCPGFLGVAVEASFEVGKCNLSFLSYNS